jgi:hypothetical protein
VGHGPTASRQSRASLWVPGAPEYTGALRGARLPKQRTQGLWRHAGRLPAAAAAVPASPLARGVESPPLLRTSVTLAAPVWVMEAILCVSAGVKQVGRRGSRLWNRTEEGVEGVRGVKSTRPEGQPIGVPPPAATSMTGGRDTGPWACQMERLPAPSGSPLFTPASQWREVRDAPDHRRHINE